MYITSLLFLLGAVAALAIGFFQSGVLLIFISIGASLIAALFLFVGMIRARAIRGATAGAPFEPPPPIERLPPMPIPGGTEPAPAASGGAEPVGAAGGVPIARPGEAAQAVPDEVPEEVEVEVAAVAARAAQEGASAAAGSKAPPTGRPRPRARKSSARAPAKKLTTERVVVTETGKYHRASCRFVKGKGLETMARAAAQSDGYAACGVCKPG
ncbi:MAG: hypothetical protein ACRDH6_09385 [Actinomycetota bacterium]